MDAGELLFQLQNPQVYTGAEINAVRRPFTAENLNVCLVFPDAYEVGMSHQGIKLLYHLLNAMPGVSAERCFLPRRDNLPRFGAATPLFSLENRVPLARFDLLGFSLLSELNFTNVLLALQLGGLPLQAAGRGAGWPLVAAGGIAVVNPEPLRDIVDLFAIGDGEGLFPDVLAAVADAKRSGAPRQALLERLDGLPGVYVPALHPLRPAGPFQVPEMGGRTVRKRVWPHLLPAVPPDGEIVPIGDVIFNRLNLEIARGCPQACRFCQAKQYYAPLRNRGLEDVTAAIPAALAQTGYESFSLASLSSGDYPHLPGLLSAIPALVQPDIAFSLPSLRPSTLSEDLLAALARTRRTGITIVPEAGSERLRRAINKDVSDDDIMQAVDFALAHGWHKLKLYFMIGLPGEEEADVEAIPRLIEHIVAAARGRRQRLDLHVSFSSFVPKPHTPLQWAARCPLERLLERIAWLRARLKPLRPVQADFHSPRRGVVETVLSRGDARVGHLLAEAFAAGEIFTAWEDDFHADVWERLLQAHDPAPYLGEIPVDAELPWGFIEINSRREHLLAEYDRSRRAQPTPACTPLRCPDCRGCSFPLRPEGTAAPPPAPAAALQPPARYRRLRVFYEKSGDLRFFSQLAMMQQVERLLRRSGLLFAFSAGFHPRLRMATLPPLPVFAEGLQEVVEVSVQEGWSETELVQRLQAGGGGFPFRAVRYCEAAPRLGRDLREVEYEFLRPVAEETRAAVSELLLPGEEMQAESDRLRLRLDYARNGQERFGRIYRLIDPDKRLTRYLRRTRVEFASDR